MPKLLGRASIEGSLNFVPRQASCDCPKSGTDHNHSDDHDLDDDGIRDWIANDESLYDAARSAGVEEI